MRILRFVGKAILALVVLALVAWVVVNQVLRWQTQKSLAEQASTIAAHREAQRAAPAGTPAAAATPTTSVTPSVTGDAIPAANTSAAPVPDAPPPAAIAWTTGWSGFRGARRDGHYNGGPIQTDWTKLRPLWRQ